MEKISYILSWIQEISKSRPELNGFPICPYAAVMKNKILECSVNDIKPVDGVDLTIFIIEDSLTYDEVEKWVEIYKEKYEDYKFFSDCASHDVFINGIKTNNDKYNLIFAQPVNQLKKLRKSLAKTSYYHNWDDDYLKKILEEDYNLVKNAMKKG